MIRNLKDFYFDISIRVEYFPASSSRFRRCTCLGARVEKVRQGTGHLRIKGSKNREPKNIQRKGLLQVASFTRKNAWSS